MRGMRIGVQRPSTPASKKAGCRALLGQTFMHSAQRMQRSRKSRSSTEPGGRIFASPAQRQFVLAGFCGGFTTFSIFSLETVLLVERGSFDLAMLNVGASIVSWLIAVWLGYRVGRHLNRLKA